MLLASRVCRLRVSQANLCIHFSKRQKNESAAGDDPRKPTRLPYKETQKVVILGAGIAGLSAAQRLAKYGFKKITILEASNRAGGRVSTSLIGGSVLELGAQQFEDANLANSAVTLAAREELIKGPKPRLQAAFGHIYASDGRSIAPNVVDAARTAFANALAKVRPTANTSLHDGLQRALKNEVITVESHEQEDAKRVQEALMLALRGIVGEDLQLVSSEHIQTHSIIPGGQMSFPEGGVSLISPLLRDLPANSLKLDHPVCTVRWGSTLEPDDPAPAKVVCCSGEVVPADFVLFTLPLGVLKQHALRLLPNIPRKKLDAISKLGIGRSNVLCLEFEKPFWVPSTGGEVVQLAFSKQQHKKNGPPEPDQWFECLTSLKELSGNSRVLHGLVTGPGAVQLEELSDEQVIEDVTRLLRQHTGNPLIPEPVRVVRSAWCGDPDFLGSSTFLSVSARPEHIKTLAQPMCEEDDADRPVVMFAGEATNEAHLGTLHGAQLSGVREADRIISTVAHMEKCCPPKPKK
ncbi:peroxisomal N(1)-acetyl-spermine/spermidine oxidase-like [Neocloeon triangulifer]|uniref:peroxisomal N(1)-acetyl-spermine/spermidine oxidase-like n=1 Tax=Neocloeon triangulifer TaxID=2078957 RepID=UPI00286EC494|nr:peroxisomal N(1)-acetyl-spermine/spermidine oxidase-like [Neocloeon triangulifer]